MRVIQLVLSQDEQRGQLTIEVNRYFRGEIHACWSAFLEKTVYKQHESRFVVMGSQIQVSKSLVDSWACMLSL
jgi:hypothetical protein